MVVGGKEVQPPGHEAQDRGATELHKMKTEHDRSNELSSLLRYAR